jgi:hypothetical protein
MDGASVDFIVIPIVAIISLATWLAAIYWADSHPRTSPRTTTAPPARQEFAVPEPAPQGLASHADVPRQATAPVEDSIPAQR